MRTWILIGLAFLMGASLAIAAPAYGTKMPDKGQAFWGLQHYYIERRNLSNDVGSLHSHQNHLLLSYGLAPWFSLDLKWSLYSRFKQASSTGGTEYENPVWGGGYGFRVRLYERGPVKAVAGFQHISIHPKTIKANGIKENGILDDWQYSALVSYAFHRVTPYAGLRYAMLDHIHLVNNEDRNRIRSDRSRRVGLILGVDVPLTEKTWLNLESDWQDGGAVAGSLNFRF